MECRKPGEVFIDTLLNGPSDVSEIAENHDGPFRRVSIKTSPGLRHSILHRNDVCRGKWRCCVVGDLTFGDSEGCLRDGKRWRESWVGAVSLAIAEKNVSVVRKGLTALARVLAWWAIFYGPNWVYWRRQLAGCHYVNRSKLSIWCVGVYCILFERSG